MRKTEAKRGEVMNDLQIIRVRAYVRMWSESRPLLQTHSETTQEGWFLGNDAMRPFEAFMSYGGGDHHLFLAKRP